MSGTPTDTTTHRYIGHGSLMAGLGWSADWMCQWIRKMGEEDIKYVSPKPDVVDDFNAYADEIMQTLVWSGGCQSWYKSHRVDGKVTAVWAGSVIGYREMIDKIRPEDFEVVYRSKNRFRFMGNGRTKMVSLESMLSALEDTQTDLVRRSTTPKPIWLSISRNKRAGGQAVVEETDTSESHASKPGLCPTAIQAVVVQEYWPYYPPSCSVSRRKLDMAICFQMRK